MLYDWRWNFFLHVFIHFILPRKTYIPNIHDYFNNTTKFMEFIFPTNDSKIFLIALARSKETTSPF